MPLHIVSHPLVEDVLVSLRDKSTPSTEFRRLARRVGLLLAAGRPLAAILAELGHVAEGVPTAATVLARARRLGVEMPITEAVAAVLQGQLTPAQALVQLMRREARPES